MIKNVKDKAFLLSQREYHFHSSTTIIDKGYLKPLEKKRKKDEVEHKRRKKSDTVKTSNPQRCYLTNTT